MPLLRIFDMYANVTSPEGLHQPLDQEVCQCILKYAPQ